MSDWATLRERFSGKSKRVKLSYYAKRIRELVEAGFLLADAEMEALYDRITAGVPQEESDYLYYPYFEDRESTYPEVRKTKRDKFGFYAYGTHDRSEHIDGAIETLARLHKRDIAAGRAWLMPVQDDEEYISWEFDVVVGDREKVLATLRAAVELYEREQAQD